MVGLVMYLWPHRSRAGVLSFLFLVLVAGEWSLTYALEMNSLHLDDKLFWAKMQYLGIPLLAVAWLTFAYAITGRPLHHNRRTYWYFFVIPLITIFLAWTTELHGLIYRSTDLKIWGPYTILTQHYGPWFWVTTIYSYTLVFAGTLRLLSGFDWKQNVFRAQGISLVIGAALPWLGNLSYLIQMVPIPNYDWTPVLFSISGFLLFFSLLRLKFLDLVPMARTAVLQSMQEGVIVLDHQDRILDINRSGLGLLNCQDLKLVGRHVGEVFPEIMEAVQACERMRKPVEIITTNGVQEHVLELKVSPLYSENVASQKEAGSQVLGRLVVFQDVTERKQMVAELRSSEESYHGLFNSLVEAVYIQDQEGHFLEVNHGAVEMYGYPRDFFIGKTPEIISAPGKNDFEALKGQLERAFAGEPQRFEFWGQRSTGEVFPKEVRLYKSRYFGEDVIVALASDISERKKIEQSIRTTNQELERRVYQRTADLQAAYHELESFASSFTQDLRVPLNLLKELTSDLEDGYAAGLDGAGQSCLEDMHRVLAQMNTLIDGLLSLSRYTRADIHFESVDLGVLAKEILAEFQLMEPERKVSLTIQPNMQVNGDAGMLRVMLEHLLSNAWKCTRYRPQPVLDFGVRTESGQKVFYLHDNGIGFDLALSGKLFVPFQRLHKQTDFDGVGIGLATVQRIIRRHGGGIWAYSEPGRGASFFFYLESIDPEYALINEVNY